jgi:hypothetical protein
VNETRDTTWIKVKSVRRIPTWANLFDAELLAPVLFNDHISHTHASGLPCSCPRCTKWPWSTYLKWRISGYCPFDCRRWKEEDHRKCFNCYSRGRDSKPMLPQHKAEKLATTPRRSAHPASLYMTVQHNINILARRGKRTDDYALRSQKTSCCRCLHSIAYEIFSSRRKCLQEGHPAVSFQNATTRTISSVTDFHIFHCK